MRHGNWNKKMVIITLFIALCTLLMTGCTSTNSEGKDNTSSKESTANKTSPTPTESKKPLKTKLWLGWSATINKDSLVLQEWRDNEPGVNVELETTQGDSTTALNLKLNTGGFEDAAVFGRSDIVKNAMINSGRVLSVEQYFEMPDKYPGLASIPKQYLDQMKDKDGHIWSIPTWYDQNPDDPWPGWASQGWFVRSDLVEKVGMKLEDLATIEGVEAFMKKVAEEKDASGKPIIPLSFLMDPNDNAGYSDENAILTAFGVTTGSGGPSPVEKKGDSFEFLYDNPQYKAAYKWMSQMYRTHMIDPEIVTSKKEMYQERTKSGRFAINTGSMWNLGNADLWERLDGPTELGWYYQLVPFPKVDGVDKLGINQVINPYPQDDVYIDKDTKNLDAILKLVDYTLTPKPEMQQIVNEGPTGKYWDWVGQPLGNWKFVDPEYEKARNSGDQAQKAKVTPELYMLSSFNNEWYPWWNYNDGKAGYKKTTDFSAAAGKMGTVRNVHYYDMVRAKTGGLWEKYAAELENVRKEYRAKVIMSNSDDQFEANWNEFQNALEKRGHWSDLKKEWLETADEMKQKLGDF